MVPSIQFICSFQFFYCINSGPSPDLNLTPLCSAKNVKKQQEVSDFNHDYSGPASEIKAIKILYSYSYERVPPIDVVTTCYFRTGSSPLSGGFKFGFLFTNDVWLHYLKSIVSRGASCRHPINLLVKTSWTALIAMDLLYLERATILMLNAATVVSGWCQQHTKHLNQTTNFGATPLTHPMQ